MEAPICPPEPPKREIVRVTKTTIKEKPSAFSSVGSAGKDGGGGVGGALNAAVFKRFHSSAPGARAEGGHVETGEDGDLGFDSAGDSRLDVEEIGAECRREPRNKRKSPLGARPTMLARLAFLSICSDLPLLSVFHSMMTISVYPGGDEHGSDAKARRVVVLGDDPRPRPASRRGRARPTRGGEGGGEGGRALYNHCKIEIPCPELLLTAGESVSKQQPDPRWSVLVADASGGGWWHGDMEGVDGEEVGWTDDMWEGRGSVTLGGLEWH